MITTSRRHTVRRAFTLLEILMAAFVIALGSLGLLALFAGAASQQQASAQLTESVRLSKNAEAFLRSSIQNLGTESSIGCPGPTFNTDAWYALPAHPDFGFLTVNPSDNPGSDALFVEADPRAGVNPITLYRAASSLTGDVFAGIASSGRRPPPEFSESGNPSMTLTFGNDRRILLSSNDDDRVLRVTVYTAQIATTMPPNEEVILTNLSSTVYDFNGDCNDLNGNFALLGSTVAQPMSTSVDHVQINTQNIPVDGEDPAQIWTFFIEDVERYSETVNAVINSSNGDFDGYVPATHSQGRPVLWLDTNDLDAPMLGEFLVREVTDVMDAEFTDLSTLTPAAGVSSTVSGGFTSVRSPAASTDVIVPGSDPLRISDDFNGLAGSASELRLIPGTRRAPSDPSAAVPAGPFVVEIPPPAGAASVPVYYQETDPANGDAVGTFKPFMYSPTLLVGMDIQYARRSDELVSLNDRISSVRDTNAPGGERPDLAYSVLYRDRGGRASDQFVVFTYTLRPERNDAEWFPPESAPEIENDEAPLRRARDVELRYDNTTRRYLLEVDRDEHGWMAQPGQLLLFAGAHNGSAPPLGPGAESPVRVVNVAEFEAGRFILTLDRAPRSSGESLLRIFYGDATSGAFDVWGIQPTVRSTADDSLWRLDPIEARVFQAGDDS